MLTELTEPMQEGAEALVYPKQLPSSSIGNRHNSSRCRFRTHRLAQQQQHRQRRQHHDIISRKSSR